MFELIIGFIVATILFIAEYLLCTKLKSPLWGGIIPVLILAGTFWIFASGRIPLETRYLFPFYFSPPTNLLIFAPQKKRRVSPVETSIVNRKIVKS